MQYKQVHELINPYARTQDLDVDSLRTTSIGHLAHSTTSAIFAINTQAPATLQALAVSR